jgi:hypothetical protein
MKTCEVRSQIYNKIFSALNQSHPARKEAAAIMTHYAVQNRIDPSLTVWQIIEKSHRMNAAMAGIRMKQSQPKEEDPNVVPDKEYPQSAIGDDYDSCVKGLLDLGIDSDRAKTECETQYGGKGTVSGKTRKAVLDNIMKKYPNISQQSARDIVNQTIKEASQIRQASVENETVEVPYWVLATRADIRHLTESKKVSNLKGAALDEHITYMQAIHEPISDVLRNRAVNRDEQARIKSASVNKDTDAKKPAWARALDL